MGKMTLDDLRGKTVADLTRLSPAQAPTPKKEKKDSSMGAEMNGMDLPDLSGVRSAEELEAEAKKVETYLGQVRSTIRNILGVFRVRPGSREAEQSDFALQKILSVKDRGICEKSEWFYAAEFISAAIEHGTASIWEVTRHLGTGKDAVVSLLCETDRSSGRFRFVFGRKMIVPAPFSEDVREVVGEVFRGLYALDKVSRERSTLENAEKREEFLQDVNRSWDDLMNEIPDMYVLGVPDGTHIIRRGPDAGKEVTDFGGLLKVEVWGKRLKPIGALNRLERSMRDMITCGLSLPVRAIAEERLFLDLQTRRELPDPEKPGMAYALHSALRRSFLAHLETEAKREVAERASARATISHEEFLLDKADGVGFVTHFNFSRKDRDRTYRHPWALVERSGGRIRLVDTNYPDLFSGVGIESMEEGDNFNGIKDPLRAFLRLALNKVRRKQEESGGSMVEAEHEELGPEPERREIPIEGK